MSKVSLEPYLFFDGQAKEAMEFYKSVFGGELEISTFGDTPDMPGMDAEEVDKARVMHASLVGGDVKLMASDTTKASKTAAKIELSLGGTDEEHMTKIFNALAGGGTVKMPLKKEFWGDKFGQLTDKYGIDWMMNIGSEAS